MASEATAAPITPDETNVSVSNSVALIGLVLICVAIGLCVLLFGMANQLPDKITEFSDIKQNSPTHLRLLILSCSTAVLVIVSFVLCVVGLFLPNRPRGMAIAGTSLSLLVMLGVFGVLTLGVVMNPRAESVLPPPEAGQGSVASESNE